MASNRSESDSLTGALFSQKPRGYGTTPSSSSSSLSSAGANKPKTFLTHSVTSTDTLQALAVRYDVPIADIKRTNKLWNNESLALRYTIEIPVYDSVNVSVTTNGGLEHAGTSQSNGSAHISCSKRSETKTETKSELSATDFLAKFDTSLSSLKKKVETQVSNAAQSG